MLKKKKNHFLKFFRPKKEIPHKNLQFFASSHTWIVMIGLQKILTKNQREKNIIFDMFCRCIFPLQLGYKINVFFFTNP